MSIIEAMLTTLEVNFTLREWFNLVILHPKAIFLPSTTE